ncbi:hypothetical protein JL721_1665 [Aureococcus anophagefferens]|nr:hypothetical protein JL721_1665 [Aureococcus anophagefferens]
MASSPRQTFNGEQHEPRGAPVWIADGDALWVPATVENRKEAEDGSVEFEALAHLHEPAILEALKRRYDHKSIYTSVGSILLAVNPFKRVPNLYAPETLASYRRVGAARFASPDSCAAPLPHVYGVADKAYRAMLRGLVDAASGAASRFGKWIELEFDGVGRLHGANIKTYLLEKVRLVHQAEGERTFHAVYELCNGLEAGEERDAHGLTGCAAPEAWDLLASSSRRDRDDGADDAAMLREVRRAGDVMGIRGDDMRALYACLAGLLRLGNVQFEEEEHATVDNKAVVAEASKGDLETAAALLGLEPEDVAKALTTRSLAVKEEGAREDSKIETSVSAREAREACVGACKAVYALLFAHVVAEVNGALKDSGGHSGFTPPAPTSRKGGRNGAAPPEARRRAAFIGILDIFGFEVFDDGNSFEQLLINYTNERMQKNFNDFVFESEQKEYVAERVEWSFVDFPSNVSVLKLLEGSPGVLKLVDDECWFPNGTDKALATKLYRSFGGAAPETEKPKPSKKKRNVFAAGADVYHPDFDAGDVLRAEGAFRIRHYAGSVEYLTEGFLAKNRDARSSDLDGLLKGSSRECVTFPLVLLEQQAVEDAAAMAASPKTPGNVRRGSVSRRRSSVGSLSEGGKMTLATQFKFQLRCLMDRVALTAPSYVRCLKPNDRNKPGLVDAKRLVEQLRYCGVLEAVRVARAGYAVRMPHGEFAARYKALAADDAAWSLADSSDAGDARRAADVVLDKAFGCLFPDEDVAAGDVAGRNRVLGAAVGLTKVFLRQFSYDGLESLLSHRLMRARGASASPGGAAAPWRCSWRSRACPARGARPRPRVSRAAARARATLQSNVRMVLAIRRKVQRKRDLQDVDKLKSERARLMRMLDSLRKDLGEVQKRASGSDDQANQYLDIIRDLQNEVKALKVAETKAKLAKEKEACGPQITMDLFGDAEVPGGRTEEDVDGVQVCGCVPA